VAIPVPDRLPATAGLRVATEAEMAAIGRGAVDLSGRGCRPGGTVTV
jgi:hypothetical protein